MCFLWWKIAVLINVNINLDVMSNCLLSRQSSQKPRILLPSLVFWFVPKVPSYNYFFQRKSKMRAVFDGQPVVKYDGLGRTEV